MSRERKYKIDWASALIGAGLVFFVQKFLERHPVSIAGIGNINILTLTSPEDMAFFKSTISGILYTENGVLPYKLDDFTNQGGNYTIYVPYKDKDKYTKTQLRRMLRHEVDVDKVTITYVKYEPKK